MLGRRHDQTIGNFWERRHRSLLLTKDLAQWRVVAFASRPRLCSVLSFAACLSGLRPGRAQRRDARGAGLRQPNGVVEGKIPLPLRLGYELAS